MIDTIYDVEVSPTKSMVGFMDNESGEVAQFQHDEKGAILKYLKGRRLIGFNSKKYDNVILTAMLRGKSAKKIYKISVDLIDGDGISWNYPDLIRHDIDVMEVAAGKAGLKIYASRLGAKKLQDLPYNPHEKHTKKMWKRVCEYNVNDLEITKMLYDFLKPQLDIRAVIGTKYGIDVMSKSDAQIAEHVFKKVLNITKKPKIIIPELVEYKAPKYIKFKTKQLKKLKAKFEESVYMINRATGKFIAQDWLKEKINVGGVDYTIGYGGLHSNEKSMTVTGGLKNTDISGMYPNLIINSGEYPEQLGSKWAKMYADLVAERMQMKLRIADIKKELKELKDGN